MTTSSSTSCDVRPLAPRAVTSSAVAAVGERVGSPREELRPFPWRALMESEATVEPALVLQLGADRGGLTERVPRRQHIRVAVAVGRDDARLEHETGRRGGRVGGTGAVRRRSRTSMPRAERTPSASIVHV